MLKVRGRPASQARPQWSHTREWEEGTSFTFPERRWRGGTGDRHPSLCRSPDDGRWAWGRAAGGPLPLVVREQTAPLTCLCGISSCLSWGSPINPPQPNPRVSAVFHVPEWFLSSPPSVLPADPLPPHPALRMLKIDGLLPKAQSPSLSFSSFAPRRFLADCATSLHLLRPFIFFPRCFATFSVDHTSAVPHLCLNIASLMLPQEYFAISVS